jgi:drug/metabolite transporter (DMT)-like permease
MNVFQANICLLCVTLCWSTEVIILGCIPDTVSSFATTCITSFVGGCILLACFFKRIIEEIKKEKFRMILHVFGLATMNMIYNLLYIAGLRYFDVSTGAFTISMTVVVLPVILMTFRQKTQVKTWISAVFVFVGILVVLLKNATVGHFWGIVFMILGCIVRSAYIVLLNKAACKYDTLALSSTISISVGIFSFIPWVITQPQLFAAIPWNKETISCLAIYSYFVVAMAQTLNIFAQKKSTPANATVIYSMEIVFSVIWGAVLPASLITPVKVTPFIILGTLLVVFGNIIEIVPIEKLFQKKEKVA